MKRTKIVCFLFLAVVIAMVWCLAPQTFAAEKTWKLRGQSAWGKGFEFFDAGKKFTELVEIYTGGKVKLQLHSAGELCPPMEEYDAVGRHAIDFASGCPCYALPKSYALSLYCDSPASQSATEKIAWLYYGGGLEILQDLFMKHYKIKAFPYAVQTSELWIYSNKEINTLDDVRGLKMRAAGTRADVMKYIGGSMVVLPGSEILPAMQRGVIDAFEASNITIGEKTGFFKVAKYLYFNPGKTAHTILIFGINPDVWNQFPKKIQQEIEMAIKDNVYRSLTWNRIADIMAMKRAVEKNGCQLKMLPEQVMVEFNQLSDKFYQEKAAKDPEMARLLDSWNKFGEDYGAYAKYVDHLDKTDGLFGQKTPYKKQ
jgi:TRAP-type mannitol/chloroaromatic compound transport system substrate-binding protein